LLQPLLQFHPAANDASDVGPCDRYLLAGRGNTYQVTSVRRLSRPAVHHLISFSDLKLNSHIEVREGGTVHTDELFVLLRATYIVGVVNVIGSDKLVYYG